MTTPNLFIKERFQMHAGGFSDFKIECDALTEKDYKTLAFLVSNKIKFKKVYGIPRGGLPFEYALKEYEDENATTILIADDVLTTGKSIVDHQELLIKEHGYKAEDIQSIVVFARGKLLDNTTAIFNLNADFWQND